MCGGAYSFGDLVDSHPIPPPSIHGEEGSFPGCVPLVLNSESVVDIKPGNSGGVIGY